MSDVKIIGEPELIEWFGKLSSEVSQGVLVDAAMAGGLPIQNAAKEKAPRRTRNLSRSIHEEVAEQTAQYVEIAIGTDLEYAAMQEFGGVVKPKNVKYLAIPLTEEGRQYVSPRDFPRELHPVFGRSGSGVLVDKSGTAHYALRKSVIIPAHPYLRPAADEQEDAAVSATGQVLKTQLDRIAP